MGAGGLGELCRSLKFSPSMAEMGGLGCPWDLGGVPWDLGDVPWDWEAPGSADVGIRLHSGLSHVFIHH